MSKKLVTINTKPKFKTYANFAFEYSMIDTGHISLNNWYITQLTQIGYNYDIENSHSFFIISNHFSDIPLLDTQSIQRDEIKDKEEFFNYINNSLKDGFCCITELNEYYIRERNAYKEYDYDHINMIYGISYDEDIYYIIGFDKNRKYKPSTIKREDLYLAYEKTIYPSEILRAKSNDKKYDINWWKLVHDLKDYFRSGISQVAYKRDNNLFGLDVMRKSKDVLEDIKNNRYFADLRILSTIHEHKEVLKTKAESLMEQGVIFSSNVMEILEENCTHIDVCIKLFIRYTIKNEDILIDRIKQRIDNIIKNEEYIFPIIIIEIEEYIKKSNINIALEKPMRLKVPYKTENCGGAVFSKTSTLDMPSFSGTLEWDSDKFYMTLSVYDLDFPVIEGNLIKLSMLIKTRVCPIVIYLRSFYDISSNEQQNMRYEAVVDGYGHIESICEFHASGIINKGYNQFFALPWKPTYYQPEAGDKIYINVFVYSKDKEVSIIDHESAHIGARFIDYIELELER